MFQQRSYTHLVNTETLDVVRINNDIISKTYRMEVGDYFKKGYRRTRPEIYRRFKSGLLTQKSFVEVERPKGSKRYVVANIIN